MSEGTSEMPQVEESKDMSRRDFLIKGTTLATGAALFPGDLLRRTGMAIPENQAITKELAEAGQGMALALLKQVQKLNLKAAQTVEHAYKHTADITLTRDHKYEEALATFLRIAGSLREFGAVKALNEILAEEKGTYSWNYIRKIIDKVGNTEEQPLDKFKEFFKRETPAEAQGIEKYFWRGELNEPTARIYSQPTSLSDEEGLAQNTIGLFTNERPEVMMGALMTNPGGLASERWIQAPSESVKGAKYEDPQPFAFIGAIFGRKFEPPEVVYVRAQNVTPFPKV